MSNYCMLGIRRRNALQGACKVEGCRVSYIPPMVQNEQESWVMEAGSIERQQQHAQHYVRG